jgi:hypothetical protein
MMPQASKRGAGPRRLAAALVAGGQRPRQEPATGSGDEYPDADDVLALLVHGGLEVD